MITDGILLRIDDDTYWFAQADGDMFSWYKAQAVGLNVKIVDPNVWVSQIQGPRSMELLDILTKTNISSNWKYFDCKEVNISGEKIIISRSGFSNELGWEIYFRQENDIEKLGDLILKEGSKMGMIITATPVFRCRRIEAGLLSAGQDFTNKTDPFSVGLGKFIDLEKDNFIGKEALKNSNKKCGSWGLRVEKGTAMKGKNLRISGKIVGEITSSTWSPYQVCGVGIVRMQNNNMGPGTVVDVNCTNGKIQKGELCELPMYDQNGDIVRGKNKKIPNKPNPWSGIKK